jgi:tRNA (mo5U34)-methyltransferase
MDLLPLQQIIKNTSLEPLGPLLTDAFLEQIRHGDFKKWRSLLAKMTNIPVSGIDFGKVIRIGCADDCEADKQSLLRDQLQAFVPWRKGPFGLFGIDVDSEWRSDLKWSRLQGHIASLQGKTVLDVGCGNGYYGFRMLDAGAELVVGIDPHIPYVAQFWAVKHFVPELPLFVLPVALEQLPSPLPGFDTVFSMGVLYHRRSPIDHLQQLKNCLKPGGELILESLYVDGEQGYCLMPEDRYARMSNVWFVPTIATAVQWLSRCGYVDTVVIDESVTSIEEQRNTEWMPFESLADALNPNDKNKTVEGLPAPRRVIVKSRRPE